MYANDFEYYHAESVAEAVDLLEEHEGAELLAGSHGLLPRMRTGEEAPPVLVDINAVDGLSSIEVTDGDLSVGALVTHAELADSDLVREHAPALADAAGEVGDIQVRNGGTIGGNLAHGDARTDHPAAVLALGSSLDVTGSDGDRSIDAADLFTGHFETAVGEHELVTALRIPIEDGASSTYHKHRNPLSGYPLIGVGAWARIDGETIERVRVAATGNLSHPRRLSAVEAALEGEALEPASITAAAEQTTALDDDEFRPDVQASPAYCRHLLSVNTEHALRDVLDVDGE
ncbi:FAD binding domain-containing protein [Natronorubrum sulfidifaciens]|uniref:Molybdopterin dehydrogenase FAD-binding protein n=1 Tax=Natronorubrum sulfidifaciens JCM 14089 TaxID=1230460 RepID=L9W7F2_9EURY|nr:xanthine dehydrogenase family protein subunit M [Natronorubrum sulfidifaciens]ELY44263.1 molybdopterin dehydrogenase FAD-binding protein [Natronorubrum sulfidifaciens JCM 14089]